MAQTKLQGGIHMVYQLLGFVLPTAFTLTTAIINESKQTKPTRKVKATTKPKKEIIEESLDNEDDKDDEFFPQSEEDSEEEYEEDSDDNDDFEVPEIYNHLDELLSLMNLLDDGIEKAVESDPDGSDTYDRFGEYYRVIVPYIDLINVSYQRLFPSELKSQLEKLNNLISQFTEEILGDIYEDGSVGIGVQIKYQMDEINRLANIGLKEWSGRPSYESIIHNNTSEDLDETQD